MRWFRRGGARTARACAGACVLSVPAARPAPGDRSARASALPGAAVLGVRLALFRCRGRLPACVSFGAYWRWATARFHWRRVASEDVLHAQSQSRAAHPQPRKKAKLRHLPPDVYSPLADWVLHQTLDPFRVRARSARVRVSCRATPDRRSHSVDRPKGADALATRPGVRLHPRGSA